MFRKILVAEDIDSINKGIGTVLEKLDVPEVCHAPYCDEAYLKAKRALKDKVPFDLLICDLSFKADHRTEKITSGRELIRVLKSNQPDLGVIVYSIEDHPQTVKSIWDSKAVNAYVTKDRKGLSELEAAIKAVYNDGVYMSSRIASILTGSNLYELPDYEVTLLKHLANGLTQDQIEERFKKEGITPSSRSSIEKKLKELREDFNAQTTVHLITILKDLRLI